MGVLSNYSLNNFTINEAVDRDFAPGEILFVSDDVVEVISSTTYTLMKQIKVGRSGRIRTRFNLRTTGGAYAYGKIYINSIPIGAERTTNSTTYVTYTEDIDVKENDIVQLYAYTSNSGVNCVVANFRLYSDAKMMGMVI